MNHSFYNKEIIFHNQFISILKAIVEVNCGGPEPIHQTTGVIKKPQSPPTHKPPTNKAQPPTQHKPPPQKPCHGKPPTTKRKYFKL